MLRLLRDRSLNIIYCEIALFSNYLPPVPPSEVSQRMQTAHPGGRQVMLHYLLPWMNNVELVDFKPAVRRPEDCGSGEDDEDGQDQEIMMVNSRRWLRGEGWGSPRATTMVLNNLMFMTAKVRANGPYGLCLWFGNVDGVSGLIMK